MVVDDLADPLAVAMEDKPVDTHVLVPGNAHSLDQPGFVAERTKRRHKPAIAVAPLADIVGRRTINVELGIVKDFSDPLDGPRREVAARPQAALLDRLAALSLGRTIGVGIGTGIPDLPVQALPGGVGTASLAPVSRPAARPGAGPGAGAGARPASLIVRGRIVGLDVAKRLEAVAGTRAQVKVQVEMWVAVLLIDAAALGDDLVDLGAAQGGGLLVRGGGGLGAAAGEVLGGRALGQAQGELVAGEDGRGWERVLVVSYVCLSGGLTLPPHRGVESAPEVVKLLLGRQLNLRGVALYKDGHLGDHGPAGRAVGRSITIKRHGGELLLNPHTQSLLKPDSSL
jgi:hypothetical protein